jgi:uncharacterized membrane protein YkoI
MSSRNKAIMAAAVLAVVIIVPTIANAGSDHDTGDRSAPISGSALDRASTAALDHLGGGEVTGTEVGDKESLYEVEVTLDDGTQVDVQLDENFQVVGSETDRSDDDQDG